MLLQPLLDQLTALGLNGCRAALEAQQQNSQYAELPFEDRLGLLLDVECTRRADKRLQHRVKNARFALPATVEDVKFSPTRGLDQRTVEVNSRSVELTRTEFNLLQAFMENPGYTLTRDDLLEKALGYAYEGMSRALDTHIRNLRRKIEPDPDSPTYIQTVYGVGYRLTGELR